MPPSQKANKQQTQPKELEPQTKISSKNKKRKADAVVEEPTPISETAQKKQKTVQKPQEKQQIVKSASKKLKKQQDEEAKEIQQQENKETEDVESHETQEEQPSEQKEQTSQEAGVWSPDSDITYLFDELPISDGTKKAIKDMGFEKMTEVQARCIPAILSGQDVLAAAKTGSGKTIAFLLPLLENVLKSNYKQRQGLACLILSPTRELCLQIYGVIKELTKYHPSLTHGCVMGGANRYQEAQRLTKGVCLLVATPGRFLDHLMNTKGFVYQHLLSLCVDEADRMLEVGFEQELREIMKRLPTERQSLLFSATQTQNVKDIARICQSHTPIFINVNQSATDSLSSSAEDVDGASASTAAGIEQGFVVVNSENRFLLLFTFLKKQLKKKTIVFFSTCNEVKFYAELLNYIDLPVLELHGQQKQSKRTATFFEFCNSNSGVLLCTDVAARGLDIPNVDWIVQMDAPHDTKEYIHRVGRTARGLGKQGKALLFLLPQEVGFLKYLRYHRVPVSEYSFPANKLCKIQQQLEQIIEKNYYLHKSAREAYRSYMQAYAQHPLKQVFNVHSLDLIAVCKSFGFSTPPKISLKVGLKSNSEKKKGDKSRNGFSESNPYGNDAVPETYLEDAQEEESLSSSSSSRKNKQQGSFQPSKSQSQKAKRQWSR